METIAGRAVVSKDFVFEHKKQYRVFASENDAPRRHKLVIREIKGSIGSILRISLKRQEGIECRGLGLGKELSLLDFSSGREDRVHCCISHIVFYC